MYRIHTQFMLESSQNLGCFLGGGGRKVSIMFKTDAAIGWTSPHPEGWVLSEELGLKKLLQSRLKQCVGFFQEDKVQLLNPHPATPRFSRKITGAGDALETSAVKQPGVTHSPTIHWAILGFLICKHRKCLGLSPAFLPACNRAGRRSTQWWLLLLQDLSPSSEHQRHGVDLRTKTVGAFISPPQTFLRFDYGFMFSLV